MKQDNDDDYIRMAELTAVYLPCTSRLPNFPQGLCITFVIFFLTPPICHFPVSKFTYLTIGTSVVISKTMIWYSRYSEKVSMCVCVQ